MGVGLLLSAAMVTPTVASAPAQALSAVVVRKVLSYGADSIGESPTDVAVDSAMGRAWVANSKDGTISIIDTRSDSVVSVIGRGGTASLGHSPFHLAIDDSSHQAFVTDQQDNTVTVLDVRDSRMIAVIPPDSTNGIGKFPSDIAIDSKAHRGYVTNFDSGTVSVIDTVSHEVTNVVRVSSTAGAIGVAVDSSLHRAYVTDVNLGTVTVIDTTTQTILTVIEHGGPGGLGDFPRAIAVHEAAHKAYVSLVIDGTVAVIDTMANSVVKVIPHSGSGGPGIGTSPTDIAIDGSAARALVSNRDDGTVSVIDTTSDKVIALLAHDSTTGIGRGPAGIAFDFSSQRAYVANEDDGTVSAIGIPSTSAVERMSGPDRYAVAAAVSAANYEPGGYAAFIASGENFPDALSAAAAAKPSRSPVLLVARDSIPDVVAAELRRLKPKHIYVAGGPNTISAAVESALGAFAPVIRVGGADRYEVSARLSSAMIPANAPIAYIASGAVFPDALSGSSAAGYKNGPVLLVGRDSISPAITAELQRLRPARIVVLGGTNTIGDAVAAALSAYTAPGGGVDRIGGADRFEVSAGVSADTYPTGAATVYIASGAVFPDALSGSAAAALDHAPVLLVTKESIPDSVEAELDRLNPAHIVVLGGPNTISDSLMRQLAAYIVAGV